MRLRLRFAAKSCGKNKIGVQVGAIFLICSRPSNSKKNLDFGPSKVWPKKNRAAPPFHPKSPPVPPPSACRNCSGSYIFTTRQLVLNGHRKPHLRPRGGSARGVSLGEREVCLSERERCVSRRERGASGHEGLPRGGSRPPAPPLLGPPATKGYHGGAPAPPRPPF